MFGRRNTKSIEIGDLDEVLNLTLPDEPDIDADEADLDDPELLKQLQEFTSAQGNSDPGKAEATRAFKTDTRKTPILDDNFDVDNFTSLAQYNYDADELELEDKDLADPDLLSELSTLATDKPAVDQADHAQQSTDQEASDFSNEREMPVSETNAIHAMYTYTEDVMHTELSQCQVEGALDGINEDASRPTGTFDNSISNDDNAESTYIPQAVSSQDADMKLEKQNNESYKSQPELLEQIIKLQKEALAAKKQGDKKKTIQLLRQSKALKEKLAIRGSGMIVERMQQELQSGPSLTMSNAEDDAINQDTTNLHHVEAKLKQTSTSTTESDRDQMQQHLQSVIQLQKQYKEAALHYKNIGNIHQAKEMLRVSKDLLRQAVQLKNGEIQNIASLQKSLPGEPDMNLGDGRIRQVQQVEPSLASANAMEHLESQLAYQVNVCHNLAVQAAKLPKTNPKSSTSRECLLQLEQTFAADAVYLRSKRDQKHDSMPRLHFEQVEYRYKNILQHIPANQMELRILRATGLQSMEVSSTLEPFITWNFGGWPPENTAQAHMNRGETPVKKGNDPVFDFTTRIPITRSNRTFLRYVQRKKLTLEVFHNRYSYGLFRRPLFLGRLVLPLEQLLTKSSIGGMFELVDANRKKTGAKLEIQINLHEPIAGEDIVKRTEKWVIVDESSENTSQLLLRAGLTSGSANASVASSSAKSDLDLSATDPVQRESKRDRGPPQQEQLAELEEAEQEFNNVDNIVSNMVLEYEIKRVSAALSGNGKLSPQDREDLTDRKQALDIKMNMLVVQAQTGLLDLESYLQTVRRRIDREKQLALIFKKHNRLDLAKAALTRKKIMQDEVDEAEAAIAAGEQ